MKSAGVGRPFPACCCCCGSHCWPRAVGCPKTGAGKTTEGVCWARLGASSRSEGYRGRQVVISTAAGVGDWVGGHSHGTDTRHCRPPCSLMRVAIGVPVGRPLISMGVATANIITITVLKRREDGGLFGYLFGYKTDGRDDYDETRQLYFPLLYCFGRGCADFAQAGHRLQ